VHGAVYGAVSGAVHGAVSGAMGGAVYDAVSDAVGGAVSDAVDGAVGGAVGGAVSDAVGGAVSGAVSGAVGGAVHSAVSDAVDGAVGGAVHRAVGGAVGGAVHGAVHGAVYGAVSGAVHGAVSGAMGGAVYDAVSDAVDGAVGGAVGGAVSDAVGGAVDGAVYGAVGGAVHRAVGGAVGGAVSNLWWKYLGAQFWVGWPAYQSFFSEVCQLELAPKVEQYAKDYQSLSESCCWVWPHRQFAILCERPAWIHRDARGRMHSDTTMAIAFRDGWGLWRWHGVAVPERIITSPQTITLAEIQAEKNAEVRRVMIERFGNTRFLRESGAKMVHRDETGELYHAPTAPRFPPLAMVHVINSTPEPDGSRHEFYLRVPPTCKTAREAVAATFSMKEGDYAPAVET